MCFFLRTTNKFQNRYIIPSPHTPIYTILNYTSFCCCKNAHSHITIAHSQQHSELSWVIGFRCVYVYVRSRIHRSNLSLHFTAIRLRRNAFCWFCCHLPPDRMCDVCSARARTHQWNIAEKTQINFITAFLHFCVCRLTDEILIGTYKFTWLGWFFCSTDGLNCTHQSLEPKKA